MSDIGAISKLKSIRCEMRKEICQRVLKREYYDLVKYFRTLVEQKNSCLVFISRRCYVLFHLIAEIEGWDYGMALTDWGLFAFRKELYKYKSLIIVDDIGLTGTSMKKVLLMVSKYVNRSCAIYATLFAANIEQYEQFRKVHITSFKKIVIRSYCQLTQRQCNELSRKLVNIILECGTPYTTFVYPLFGIEKSDLKKTHKIMEIESNTAFEKKWSTFYIQNQNEDWINNISYFNCIRVYRSKNKDRGNFTLVLPFLFLKNVRNDKVDDLFRLIAKQFKKMQQTQIAEFINESLMVDKSLRKEALEYLMSFLSCFCSKCLINSACIADSIEIQKDIIRESLSGSFVPEFIQFLENFDKCFTDKFWSGINLESLSECFYEIDNPKGYARYEDLEKNIEKEKGKNIIDLTEITFNYMRELSEKDKNLKSISFCEIYSLLKNEEESNKNDIFLAQIECWDRGIATYSFAFSESKGLVSKCSVGEMSAIILMLRYKEIVKEFYISNLLCENELTDKQWDKNLRKVIEKEITEGRMTEEEAERFGELIKKQSGRIYNFVV